MMVYSFVKQWQSWSSEWSKDWLNRLKTQKKTESHSTKSPSSNWLSWKPLSLSCSWTAHYCYLQRSREVVEVAVGRVGYWLQITGCIHRNLRAKQSMPSSSISTLQHEAILRHSWFQCHSTEGPWPRAVNQRAMLSKIPLLAHISVWNFKITTKNNKKEDMCREIPQACLCSLTIYWGSVHHYIGAFSTFTVSHMSAFNTFTQVQVKTDLVRPCKEWGCVSIQTQIQMFMCMVLFIHYIAQSASQRIKTTKKNTPPPKYTFTEIHKNLIYTCILWLKSHLQSTSGSERVDRINAL